MTIASPDQLVAIMWKRKNTALACLVCLGVAFTSFPTDGPAITYHDIILTSSAHPPVSNQRASKLPYSLNNISSIHPRPKLAVPVPYHRPKNLTQVVLVASNPRSGSSYTGQWLASYQNATYFYEPLWIYSLDKNKTRGLLQPRTKNKLQLIGWLMQCNYNNFIKRLISEVHVRKFIFKQPHLGIERIKTMSIRKRQNFYASAQQVCLTSSYRVTKLIRMDLRNLTHDMLEGKSSMIGPNYKVIYLARDPRGVINSLRRAPDQWNCDILTPQRVCQKTWRDIEAAMEIRQKMKSRLLLIRYEDLVDLPMETNEKVWKFLGKEEHEGRGYKFLKTHSNGYVSNLEDEETTTANRSTIIKTRMHLETMYRMGKISREKYEHLLNGNSTHTKETLFHYYSLYRSTKFRHDSWRKYLSPKTLEIIKSDRICQKIFRAMNYPLE